MLSAIRSLWTWSATTVLVLLALPAMALTRLFDRDAARYHTGRVFRWIGGLTTRLNPTWEIEVSGEPPADPRRPYVVVSNHQSFADIPVISRLPWEMKWVVKAELFKVPIFGWLMRMAGDIPVERENKISRAKTLVHARQYLQDRCSVMFFPEGTRTLGGKVGRFSDGPFGLAIKEQVPVLPLAIDGTQDALPKHSWKFGEPSQIRLHVLAPVETSGLTSEDTPVLRERIRAAIIEQVAQWHDVPPGQIDAAPPDAATNEAKTALEDVPVQPLHPEPVVKGEKTL